MSLKRRQSDCYKFCFTFCQVLNTDFHLSSHKSPSLSDTFQHWRSCPLKALLFHLQTRHDIKETHCCICSTYAGFVAFAALSPLNSSILSWEPAMHWKINHPICKIGLVILKTFYTFQMIFGLFSTRVRARCHNNASTVQPKRLFSFCNFAFPKFSNK